MNAEMLAKAEKMAAEIGHVFVATADEAGLPHLAAAGKLSREGEKLMGVEAWFCPGTLANLQENRRIALVVWDPAADEGYQLVGRVEDIKELAVMDGFAPELDKDPPLPQVDRQLLVRVNKIIRFTHAPHSDAED